MKKKFGKKLLIDTSLNSSMNSHNIYHETDPSKNIFYNTSNNFRTNLYQNKFKNINVINNNNNNKFNLTSQSFNKQKNEKIKKATKEQMKNYVIYLKNNINTSFHANNELNNEYNKLLSKLRKVNESITKNNDIYNKLNNSYKINLEKNKKNRNIYINLIEQYKLYNNNDENKNNNLNQIINKQENDIIKLIKENKDLNDEINNKKNLIKKLQVIIELIKYKQIFINLTDEKNKLEEKNNNLKNMKNIINKNEELKLIRDKLKYELSQKDNEFNDISNIKNNLYDKIKILMNTEDNNNNLLSNNNFNKSFDNINNIKNNNKCNNNNFILIEDENNNERFNTINDLEQEKRENNKPIQDYEKLIEEENQINSEINEEMKLKKSELKLLSNKIEELVNKSKEEISLLKYNINNLNLNNKEIKSYIDQQKTILLDTKQKTLEFNKKIKTTLSLYKNKKELNSNKTSVKTEMDLSFVQDNKNNNNDKIFNIQTIKRENSDRKLKSNLSEPSIIKENNNIINNKWHYLSFDNIFNKKIKTEFTPRIGKYIYTIDNKGRLLSYGIDLKKFVYINISSIKGWNLFYPIYQKNSEGSLFLNTFNGLFILTGDNYNKLYYYSQNKNEINLIKIFKTNFKNGGILSFKDEFNIILLGGEFSTDVILFSLEKNEEIYLPKLNNKRINSSYNIINDRYIITFFGKGNNTIEYLDLNNINNSWNILNYKSNGFIKELSGHIGFNVNNNIIIIVGGKNNNNIIVFYFKEKFMDITDIKININNIELTKDNNIKQQLLFDKEKCFNILINDKNNTKEIIGMDNEGNVHCFNEDYAYNIFVF